MSSDRVEYVRPAEFDNDHDWAQAAHDDKLFAEEKLREREWALERIEDEIKAWRECQTDEAACEAPAKNQDQARG